MTEFTMPSSRKLRWPILVVLDDIGEENAILEFQQRVAVRLGLPEGAGDVLDPKTGEPLLTERLLRAIGDLYAAGAVDGDEDGGRMWITDGGRGLTETEAEDLPRSGGTKTALRARESRRSDWLGLLDLLPW
jgi:hypothetical protein